MRSIPYALQQRIDQQFQTMHNDANPHASVAIARAKSTVQDSSYFSIETIRDIAEAGDVAVSARRLANYGPPDRIYEIHIEAGIAKTSLREYPDKLKEFWKPQFTVGPAAGVSIVFDGRWTLNKYRKFALQTYEEPWIFWIDLTGALFAQLWDDESTRIQLASDVVTLDTVRGWIPAQAERYTDQGVIATYVKTDGKVYYRGYCLQDGGAIIWEVEREIPELGTGCLGIRVFRTNDYRTGFIAKHATTNVFTVTKRNWGGMAVDPGSVVASASVEIHATKLTARELNGFDEHLVMNMQLVFQPLRSSDYAFVHVENVADGEDWGTRVAFELVNAVTDLHVTDFELRDAINTRYACFALERTGDQSYVGTFANFNGSILAGSTLLIRCTGAGTLTEAGTALSAFEFTFVPTNLVAPDTDVPVVEAAWNL